LFLVSYLPNQKCIPNLKLLALAVAQIGLGLNRWFKIYLDTPLALALALPTLVLKVVFC